MVLKLPMGFQVEAVEGFQALNVTLFSPDGRMLDSLTTDHSNLYDCLTRWCRVYRLKSVNLSL